MEAELFIRDVRMITPEGQMPGGVAVEGGRIKALTTPETPCQAAKVYDGRGLLLLPGVVDIHVHFREPGQEYKATYASESSAAAVGGVTTICDMPNNGDHAVTDLDRFRKKAQVARASSRVDFGIYAYMVSRDRRELETLRRDGLMGLKYDMSLAGVEVSPGRVLPPPEDAEDYFRAAAETGLRIGIHAEDRALVMQRTAELRALGRTDAAAHLEARPVEAEVRALQQVVRLVRATHAQVHIHHLSSAEGLGLLRRARADGLPITAETIPAFLFFDDSDYEALGTLIKIHPSIKYRSDRDALWEGLRDGSIDCVATDHAPHTVTEKQRSVWEASPGVIGVQTSLCLLLDAVSHGRLPLERCVELLSRVPAELYGFGDRKGSIRPGADADLVLVDPALVHQIRNDEMYTPNRLTPYDGRLVRGVPVATWLRGIPIAEHGRVVGEPHGEQVFPKTV